MQTHIFWELAEYSFTGDQWIAMQFDIRRIRRIKARCDFVQFACDPIALSFKNRHARKNESLLLWVMHISGFVGI